jgi:hypothetical protein
MVTAVGLALTLFAASPAIKATGTFGLALAADTPPAVAQPGGAANNALPGGSSPAGEPVAADLTYHRETFYYTAGSLRDPFGSLIRGNFVADGAERLPDIGSIELLGVIWGDSDKFALVEDKEGQGWVLRVGDPVVNGEVAGITRDTLTIRQYFFGTSTTVTLKLKPREGNADARKHRR